MQVAQTSSVVFCIVNVSKNTLGVSWLILFILFCICGVTAVNWSYYYYYTHLTASYPGQPG